MQIFPLNYYSDIKFFTLRIRFYSNCSETHDIIFLNSNGKIKKTREVQIQFRIAQISFIMNFSKSIVSKDSNSLRKLVY